MPYHNAASNYGDIGLFRRGTMREVIERIKPVAATEQVRAVIFDFDGTLSLIRSGWMEVMVPMCMEQLRGLQPAESEEQIRNAVEEFVWRLTGKETIYQMLALAEAVRARAGNPLAASEYKKMYLERLLLKIGDRLSGLRAGTASADTFLVPGSRALLEDLVERGITLYLASGTDDANVKEEAKLLNVSRYFEDRIYGAQEDLAKFSKAQLVQQIISRAHFNAEQLLVFGDGFVEIEEVKRVGGTAVGIATHEPECADIDEWKRKRLIQAGADYIIPNFTDIDKLTDELFGASQVHLPA